MVSDEKCYGIVKYNIFCFGFLEQDSYAHFEFWRLYCDSQPPAETRDQPVLYARDLARVGIARDYYLFT